MLKREDFEGLQPTIERVEIPELLDVACIRTISAETRDTYDSSINDGQRRNIKNISARLVCLCLCDETGELLYPDVKEGAAALAKWPTSIVERLFYRCRDINLMGANALEEAAKNFEPNPTDSSNSD